MNHETENRKPHPAVESMVGAIVENGPTPDVTAADMPELIRAALTVAITAQGRTTALESLTRKVALSAHRAATQTVDVAERLEALSRDPDRWTLESIRDDLDAAATDLRTIWRIFDGVIGGDTTDAMAEAIHDSDRQDEIVRGVADRFGVDPDSDERRRSMGLGVAQ